MGTIPGRGTVHQGFQLVYYSIRGSLRTLVQKNAPGCKDLLISGHSLGGALSARTGQVRAAFDSAEGQALP